MRFRYYTLAFFLLTGLSFVSLVAATSLNYNLGSRKTNEIRTIPAIETRVGVRFTRIASQAGKNELLGKWKKMPGKGILEFFNDGTYTETGDKTKYSWKVTGNGKIQLVNIPGNFTIIGAKLQIILKLGEKKHTLSFRRLTKKELSVFLGFDLMDAIKNGQIDIVRKLLKEGADVNYGSSQHGKDSTLVTAMSYDHVDIVKLLLEKGADVNVPRPLFRMSSKSKARSSLEVLLKHGADPKLTFNGENLLTLWAKKGDIKTLKMWLDRNLIDINEKNANGRTALMNINLFEHPETAVMLINNGADVNTRTEHQTILERAASGGQIRIVKLLLAKGADPNLKSSETEFRYSSPLHEATVKGRYDVVRLLLEHGATVDDRLLKSFGHIFSRQQKQLLKIKEELEK